MAKKLTIKQLKMRNFRTLEMNEMFQNSFGKLELPFVMMVWGQSAQGKSNFIIQMINEFYHLGKINYLSLEESLSLTLQNKALQHLSEKAQEEGKINFYDHSMKLPDLIKELSKKRSAKITIIDSVQYFGITYIDYKHLRQRFPRKSFIFISHAKGRVPDGKTADKIRYDAGIKVRVEGKVAFINSRYGGNKPWIIWEKGAKKYWGEKFTKVKKGV